METLYGAVLGDICGSAYEFLGNKDSNVELFPEGSCYTDDTILTVAIANAIITETPYEDNLRYFGKTYENADTEYGTSFRLWLNSKNPEPYNSLGNGSAMRVSPIGWAFNSVPEVLLEARKSAECTHNHPEGIKGAQSAALAVFMARKGKSKEVIRKELELRFGYNLKRAVKSIRPGYTFSEICETSVPEAIIAFLDATSFEGAIRNAISLGGDADTQAAIAGSIAEAYYRESNPYPSAFKLVPEEFSKILNNFGNRYKGIY